MSVQSPTLHNPVVEQPAPTSSIAGDARRNIILALLAVYIVWGTTYLAIRVALESFPPYLMMSIRFLIAGGLLFAFLRWRGWAMPTLRQWRNAALIGMLLLVFGMGSVAIAEQWVSSGLTATLLATLPLTTLLLGLLWRNVPTRMEWIGVCIGIFGVVILTFEGNLQANPAGIALLMFANFSWALGSVWMRRLDMPSGAMGNAAEMLCGGVVLLVLALLTGQRITHSITVSALGALIYLITFGSLVTLTAYTYLLNTVSPALATSYAFVNPAIALLLGVVIGGEVLTGSALLALPVILLGLAFVARSKQRTSTR